MKALITAGGRGSRLRPLTYTANKHLIPIANKPMIHYALEAVAGAGIKEVGIIINPETGEEIHRALGRGEAWGVELTYILQEAPLGLAHCVKISEPFIGREPFVFYLGDNVVVGGIQRFIEAFLANGDDCHLVLAKVKDPHRFGIVEIQDGRLVRFHEKPADPPSSMAVTGVYVYGPPIFEAVETLRPSRRGELEISDAHQYLIDRGYQVGYSEITGWWKDTGKPEDLLEANRFVLDQLLDHPEPRIAGQVDEHSDVAGKVIIEGGAEIRRSSIRGPAVIGEDTLIEGSYIGPFTAISPRCEIRNSEVEYSIVMEGSRILDAEIRIERSLLGRGVVICRGQVRPKTQRFIVGDQSTIILT